MSLAVRRDDLPLLSEMATATRAGTVRLLPARGNSYPQVVWNVQAKSDCLRLCELLNAFPLRGRKSRDYAVWSAAVLWWVGRDATRTIVNRDWTPIAYLKERLEEGRRYGPPEPIQDNRPGLTDDWPGFLAGFFTAEGWLGLGQTASGVLRPQAAVHVRLDDQALLSELCERTGAGRIYTDTGEHGAKLPSVQWIVCSRADLSKLVRVFDAFPPRGRKLREYEIWREAVLHYASGSGRQAYARLDRLREALSEARAYREPESVPGLN